MRRRWCREWCTLHACDEAIPGFGENQSSLAMVTFCALRQHCASVAQTRYPGPQEVRRRPSTSAVTATKTRLEKQDKQGTFAMDVGVLAERAKTEIGVW